MKERTKYTDAHPAAYGTLVPFIKRKPSVFSAIAQRNLKFNQNFEICGLINGQGIPPVKDMRFGFVNIAWSGCGIIAVYNALLLLDNFHPFCEVVAWGDLRASRAFGFLGTSPRKTRRLFQKLGYTVRTISDKRLFDVYARTADVCLFTFWNQKGHICRGMHTVCVQYQAGCLNVYNLTNFSPEMAHKASFEEWNKEGIGPVVLYCINRHPLDVK